MPLDRATKLGLLMLLQSLRSNETREVRRIRLPIPSFVMPGFLHSIIISTQQQAIQQQLQLYRWGIANAILMICSRCESTSNLHRTLLLLSD